MHIRFKYKQFHCIMKADISPQGLREELEANSDKIRRWAFVLHDNVPGQSEHYHLFLELYNWIAEACLCLNDVISYVRVSEGCDGYLMKYLNDGSDVYSSTGIVANFNIEKYLS